MLGSRRIIVCSLCCFSTCYIKHEVFNEVTNNSVRHRHHDQGGHEEVQDWFGQLDQVLGRRLVLLVERIHILDQELEGLSRRVRVVEAVHVSRAGASSSSWWAVTPTYSEENQRNVPHFWVLSSRSDIFISQSRVLFLNYNILYPLNQSSVTGAILPYSLRCCFLCPGTIQTADSDRGRERKAGITSKHSRDQSAPHPNPLSARRELENILIHSNLMSASHIRHHVAPTSCIIATNSKLVLLMHFLTFKTLPMSLD